MNFPDSFRKFNIWNTFKSVLNALLKTLTMGQNSKWVDEIIVRRIQMIKVRGFFVFHKKITSWQEIAS